MSAQSPDAAERPSAPARGGRCVWGLAAVLAACASRARPPDAPLPPAVDASDEAAAAPLAEPAPAPSIEQGPSVPEAPAEPSPPAEPAKTGHPPVDFDALPDAGTDLPGHQKARAGERLCVIALKTNGFSDDVDVERIFWDDRDRPVRGTEVRIREGMVRPSVIRTVERDTAGRMVRHVNDSDGDGEPNQTWTYRYDGKGRVVEMRHDRDADGTVDEGAKIEWKGRDLPRAPRTAEAPAQALRASHLAPTFSPVGDAVAFSGRVVERYTKSLRLGPSGFDWATVHEYDARGLVLRKTHHRDGDPSLEPERVQTRARGPDGQLLEIRREPPDLVLGDRETFRYAKGRLAEKRTLAGDVEKLRVEYRYGDGGELVFMRSVQDGSDRLSIETRFRHLCR